MTAICGIKDGEDVWIGADSCGGNEYRNYVLTTKKIFKNNGYLIAYTTSFRMGQILEFCDLPHVEGDIYRHMVREFVPFVRSKMSEGGFTKKDCEREEAGTFIVGIKDRLFIVDSDFSVLEHADEYLSHGCGIDYLDGSLFSTKDSPDKCPEERIELALKAAEHHSSGVTGPFHIMSTAERLGRFFVCEETKDDQ